MAQLRLAGMSLDRIRSVVDLPGEARAAELLSYWRQVEADHASRRDQLALLVHQFRGKEAHMRIDQAPHPTVASSTGIGHRDTQLDVISTGTRLFAVADGYGADPEIPKAALDAAIAFDDFRSPIDPVSLLDEAINRAAAMVAGHPGSGCTLSAIMLGDTQTAIAHVGDSRVYLVRDGTLERLSRDHTLVQSLVDEGRLTPEEARAHDDRALLNRAIASDTPPAPDISVQYSRPGDRFILTTDGVHGVLAADTMADLLTADWDVDEVAASVEAAVVDAGAPDNYSVIVIDRP